MIKTAVIRKLPNGKYRVMSHKGRNLGTYPSKEQAEKRLRQVEYFKHLDHQDNDDSEMIDLTDVDDYSLSAIMRKLNEKATAEQTNTFLTMFKFHFERAVKNKLQKPAKIALQNALVSFNKKHPIKLNKKLIKNAAISELSDPQQVGKYLANIVKFILGRVSSPDKQFKYTNSLRDKFNVMDPDEIAGKNMPPSSAIAQSINFVKHVLFGHDAGYVKEVIEALVRSL